MQATNRLSRAQREALVRQDAPFLAVGLMLSTPRSFDAHLRHAAGLLCGRQTSASLCAALGTVLDTENAEKRWLRGEDIFAAVPKIVLNTPEVERMLVLMEAQIGPTL